jgi:hypothetical protein
MKQQFLTRGVHEGYAQTVERMRRFVVGTALPIAFAVGMAFAALPAHAGTVDWTFNGTFEDNGSASGSFTADSTTGNVLSFNVITTNGNFAETGNTAIIPGSFYSSSTASLTNNSSGFEFTLALNDTSATLVLDFNSFLGDPGTGNIILPSPVFDSEETYFGADTPVPRTLTGSGNGVLEASTTPLPASLPLFATGLCALGIFGCLRKKNARSVAT